MPKLGKVTGFGPFRCCHVGHFLQSIQGLCSSLKHWNVHLLKKKAVSTWNWECLPLEWNLKPGYTCFWLAHTHTKPTHPSPHPRFRVPFLFRLEPVSVVRCYREAAMALKRQEPLCTWRVLVYAALFQTMASRCIKNKLGLLGKLLSP